MPWRGTFHPQLVPAHSTPSPQPFPIPRPSFKVYTCESDQTSWGLCCSLGQKRTASCAYWVKPRHFPSDLAQCHSIGLPVHIWGLMHPKCHHLWTLQNSIPPPLSLSALAMSFLFMYCNVTHPSRPQLRSYLLCEVFHDLSSLMWLHALDPQVKYTFLMTFFLHCPHWGHLFICHSSLTRPAVSLGHVSLFFLISPIVSNLLLCTRSGSKLSVDRQSKCRN